MKNKILIFSGMPASGKDTITGMLIKKDNRFVAFKKHRSVTDRDKIKDTYYNISPDEFENQLHKNEFLQYHTRYGRYYGIAKVEISKLLEKGKIPIIHIGRIENYYKFKENLKIAEIDAEIIHIQLWNDKNTLCSRIQSRDIIEEEVKKRIAAMEQEFDDAKNIMQSNRRPFTAVIKNDNPENTIDLILKILTSDDYNDGYDEYLKYISSL